MDRLKTQSQAPRAPVVYNVSYDSVQPVQEVIYDPNKSINLLIDNPENDL